MTDRERSESSAALNLDTPVRDSTYRQDRTTLARQGAELRESVGYFISLNVKSV